MPESAPQTDNSLGSQIMAAPEPVWKQIRGLLQVKSRQEAVEMVDSDPGARRAVSELLQGGAPDDETALTAPGSKEQTHLTSVAGPKAPRAPLSEQMYGRKRNPRINF